MAGKASGYPILLRMDWRPNYRNIEQNTTPNLFDSLIQFQTQIHG